MNWQELLLYVPAVAFIAVTGIIAWRVSKTGDAPARDMAQKPEAAARARGDALAGH